MSCLVRRTVSVTLDTGNREHHQKRLVLCNLKEAYTHFNTVHPVVKVGFSKFAELRPKECVLARASGTHSGCVSLTHQNMKLLVSGCHL